MARTELAVTLIALLLAASLAGAQPVELGPLDGPWTEAGTPDEQVHVSQIKVAYMLLRDLEGNRNRTIDDGVSMLLPPAEE